MPVSPRHVALIPAAGVGRRFGGEMPKQYALLAGKPMLVHTVNAMLAFESLDAVWVLVSPTDQDAGQVLGDLLKTHAGRLSLHTCGGDTRADTVQNGLQAMQGAGVPDDAWVWVHDAARPAIAMPQLQALHKALCACPRPCAALLATPVADTLKRAEANHFPVTSEAVPASRINPLIVETTVDRTALWQAQTPQCAQLSVLTDALKHAQSQGLSITDEASALEAVGLHPRLVLGSSHNFKVTTAQDAALMEAVLSMSSQMQPVQSYQRPPAQPLGLRMGEGMDVHALVAGRPLILGGVHIPHPKGLMGHSDADALLHAVTDALLGAAGLGDIGRLFPDTDAAHAGADSLVLLKTAYDKVLQAGWELVNVDATIVAQAPKMAAHIPTMQRNIAQCLGVDVGCVNVKAKTNEKLGWLGREEGIETRAVVMLQAAPAKVNGAWF